MSEDRDTANPHDVAIAALARENAELWRMVERLVMRMRSDTYALMAAEEMLERRKAQQEERDPRAAA